MLFNCVTPLRRTVILCTSVTHVQTCLPWYHRLSLCSSLDSKYYPWMCSRMNGVLRSILNHKMSSSVVDFFRVTLLHIVSKYHQTLDFYALCFSCNTYYCNMYNKQRKRKNSLSFFFWMDYYKSGYIRFFVVVDELELVGWEAGYEFSESVSEFDMWRFFAFCLAM